MEGTEEKMTPVNDAVTFIHRLLRFKNAVCSTNLHLCDENATCVGEMSLFWVSTSGGDS